MRERCEFRLNESLTLLTTELDALPNHALALSSVGGGAGLFTSSNTDFATWCVAALTLGGALIAAPTGGIDVWLLRTLDGVTYEYGTTTGNLAAGNPTIGVGSIAGIWSDTTAAGSAYAFDLTVAAHLAPGSYVSVVPSGSSVTLNQNAVAAAMGDTIVFVRPPARTADFSFGFAARTYMPGEVVEDIPKQALMPPGVAFKVLLRNNLGFPVPTGTILRLGLMPDDPDLEIGRFIENRGLLRVLLGR